MKRRTLSVSVGEAGVLTSEERVAALTLSGLLDKSVEDQMMSIAHAVRTLLKVEAAMVHLLDAEKQYRIGYSPDTLPHNPEPLSNSGCSQVVLSREVLAIDDTSTHPIMCQMEWASSYRSYLGAPIICYDQVLGAVCSVDRFPRKWTAHDKLTVEAFARLASAACGD